MTFQRILFLTLLFLPACAAPLAAQQKKTPNFVGTSIAEPPQQKAPWTPPPAEPQLPANLISATVRLFEQGLADPRGADYREVEVVVESEWHSGVTLKTHGWLLAGAATKQRFAVCWNGLVYPVVSVGQEVDLRADVVASIKSDAAIWVTRAKEMPDMPRYRFRGATGEGYSISPTSLLPIRVCLLLRLGEKELAERVWAEWIFGMDPKVNDDVLHLADPYLMLAINWLWAMYDRAVMAHMRGDDSMCRISALAALAMQKSNKREIEAHPSLWRGGSGQWYLNFLEPLPLLIQDQERRSKHPHETSVSQSQLELRQQTTAQLIDYLDEAFAVQMDIPGGITMSQDPVVAELIRRGKEAVEPLLAALENDTRLTRSVRSSRPWHYDRHFMTVYETACQALRAILSIGNNDLEDWESIEKGPEGRLAVAARLRAL